MNSLSGSEILVTGGAGFIGSNLAEALVKRNAKVTILDSLISPYGGNMFNLKKIKKKVKFVKGDVRSKRTVGKAVEGKDYIFHLAGQTGRVISMSKPRLDQDINSRGTLIILEEIRKQRKKPKIIFAGSRGSFGDPLYLPVDEKHPDVPRDIYGINKQTAEQYCLLFGREYGFGATSLRLNNVYGPHCQIKSNHYGTVNLFIAYALQNKDIPIYGTGKQTRDYVFVSDVVDAFVKSTSKKADNEMFIVGTGVSSSLNDVVNIIRKSIPDAKHKMVEYPQALKSVDFMEFYSTSTKIQQSLSWKPKIDLENGINKTIRFYKKNLKEYV